MEILIAMLNAWPTEAVWVLQLFVIYFAILLLLRFLGATGIYVFMVVAIIAANLLVLKPIQFSFSAQVITLGTTLFTANFLATDILNEYYGAAAARRGIYIGFAGYFLFIMVVLLGIAFPPITLEQAGPEMAWAISNHDYISTLFMPAPAIFIGSVAAYFVSQLLDVFIFSHLKKRTGGKHLWLRNNVSTLISSFIDLLVFGSVAFFILASEPMPYSEVLAVFVFGPYMMRLFLALFDTPFLYAARYCLPRVQPDNQ